MSFFNSCRAFSLLLQLTHSAHTCRWVGCVYGLNHFAVYSSSVSDARNGSACFLFLQQMKSNVLLNLCLVDMRAAFNWRTETCFALRYGSVHWLTSIPASHPLFKWWRHRIGSSQCWASPCWQAGLFNFVLCCLIIAWNPEILLLLQCFPPLFIFRLKYSSQ